MVSMFILFRVAPNHVPLGAVSHGTGPLAADGPLVVGRHCAAEATSARDMGTDVVVQNSVVEDFVVVLLGLCQY
jgi:hypothetical protein